MYIHFFRGAGGRLDTGHVLQRNTQLNSRMYAVLVPEREDYLLALITWRQIPVEQILDSMSQFLVSPPPPPPPSRLVLPPSLFLILCKIRDLLYLLLNEAIF